MCQSPAAPLAGSATEHEQQLIQLIEQHFHLAESRVDDVYQAHFSRASVIAARHWRHRRDIPGDLLVLPRTLGNLLLRRKTTARPSGKETELRQIIELELLDLPGLELALQNHCEEVIRQAGPDLSSKPLTAAQRQDFEQYVNHQLKRLHLPGEGMREALLALTVMLSGRVLGDKALVSSAASLGSTLATSVYIGQQSWWGAFWASWFGVPGWVSWAGIGTGVASIIVLSPLIAPGIEWGMNRLRARRLLQQTVEQARAQLLQKDRLLLLSRLGVYLQLLPDIAQYLVRLRS